MVNKDEFIKRERRVSLR